MGAFPAPAELRRQSLPPLPGPRLPGCAEVAAVGWLRPGLAIRPPRV